MALLPAQVSEAMPFHISPTVMVFAAVADAGHGPALRAVSGAAQHAAGSAVSSLKGQSGQPSGARGAARFRLVARHRADRALDGAARGGGLLRARAC